MRKWICSVCREISEDLRQECTLTTDNDIELEGESFPCPFSPYPEAIVKWGVEE